jgi:hypothetical protein
VPCIGSSSGQSSWEHVVGAENGHGSCSSPLGDWFLGTWKRATMSDGRNLLSTWFATYIASIKATNLKFKKGVMGF